MSLHADWVAKTKDRITARPGKGAEKLDLLHQVDTDSVICSFCSFFGLLLEKLSTIIS